MIIEIFILVAIIAFVCEWIDSSLGMGYGTILSPLLILFGYPASTVVPSILITQAMGGLLGAISHHKLGNAHFSLDLKEKKWKLSEDLKVVLLFTLMGVIATIVSTIVALNISKTLLTTYIGALVLSMGIFVLLGLSFKYSAAKMLVVGVVSSFNKGLSGGGFGPVVTGGQIVLGQEHKKAIAFTTAAEPLICITAFLAYLFLKGISDWSLIYALGTGAIIGGVIGPRTTFMIRKNVLRRTVGLLMVVLGAVTLSAVFNLISIKISI